MKFAVHASIFLLLRNVSFEIFFVILRLKHTVKKICYFGWMLKIIDCKIGPLMNYINLVQRFTTSSYNQQHTSKLKSTRIRHHIATHYYPLHAIDVCLYNSVMRAQVKEGLDGKKDPKREVFVACQNKTYALMESQSFPNFTASKQFHRALLALVTTITICCRQSLRLIA